MRKILLLIASILMFAGLTKAQTKTVTGKVTDGSNAPLAYVTVSIKGTTLGTLTKEDGTFSISVPPTATTLVFSAIGQETKEVAIGSQTSFNVTLAAGQKTLDEVVIAYGTQKRTSFTGSAATVKGDVLENRPVTSFEKALQGQATGVTVQSVSGQPGGNSTVRIRGVGSFTASNTPLYVLDGVAITEGDFTQAQTTSNVLNTLDPKDIESITVLKDATAAGLYGSRAANGVIMITTKKGRAGKSTISFTANNGWSKIAVKRHDVMSGQEYYKYWFDNFYNRRIAAGLSPEVAATNANDSTFDLILQGQPFYSTLQALGPDGQPYAGVRPLHNTDWRDAILNTGRTQEYSMNVAGGSDKTRFYLSGSYFDQKGIVLASDFKRYSAKLNLEHNATSFLKVGANTTLAYTEQNTPAGAGGGANPIRFAEQTANVFPLYAMTDDTTGTRIPNPAGGYMYDYNNPITKDYNPVGLGEDNIYRANTVRAIVSGFAEASFLKDFRLKSLATMDYIDILETQYYNPVHGDGAAVDGRTYKFRPRDVTLTITNTLNYSHQFGKHNVDVLLGQEAVRFKYQNIYTLATTFPFDQIVELDAAATPVTASSDITEKRISSLFSRANYNYDDKYFLTASLRRDGSSIFGEDSRYGTFWTVGGGWRIGREEFFSDISWVDELKVKASYGTAGNDRIGRYARLGLYDIGAYNGAPGMTYGQLENRQLKWEQNDVMDLGVEFSFLNRFRTEFTYFTRWSKDILFSKPLSYLTGFSSISTNLATMKNYGVEGTIEATIFNNRDFSWTSSVNVTTVKNVIQSMTVDSIVQGSKRWQVGEDRYMWYLRKWAGVDPADGRPMWYADEVVNGAPTGKQITTKTYNSATYYEVGSSLPKFYGGFNNNFSYKGFELSILTYFSVGGKIYDANLAMLEHVGIPGQQLATSMNKAWTTAGQETDIPRFYYNNNDLSTSTSTRYLFDGSYVRLKNVSLGYNLPKSFISKAKITNARIYVSGENFATWAKHKGMDPEVEIDGVTSNDVPNIKTFTVGVNIGF